MRARILSCPITSSFPPFFPLPPLQGLYVLLSATQPGKKTASTPPRDGQTPVLKAALSAHSRGNWDFEQRLMWEPFSFSSV